jgi:hypothetical protein
MITARSGKVAVSFPSAQVLLATMKYAIHMNCCFFRPPKSYWLSSKAHNLQVVIYLISTEERNNSEFISSGIAL